MTKKLAEVLAERSNKAQAEETAKRTAEERQRDVRAEERISDMKARISGSVRALHQSCRQTAEAAATIKRQITCDEDFPSTEDVGRHQGEIEALYRQIADGAAQLLRTEDGLTVTVNVIGNDSVLQMGDIYGNVYRIQITMSW